MCQRCTTCRGPLDADGYCASCFSLLARCSQHRAESGVPCTDEIHACYTRRGASKACWRARRSAEILRYRCDRALCIDVLVAAATKRGNEWRTA